MRKRTPAPTIPALAATSPQPSSSIRPGDHPSIARGGGTLTSGWYRVFTVTLALSLISAIASISVVVYISRSLQTSVATVDTKSSMTIDLRRAMAAEVALVHQMIDLGSPAAEPFLDADRHTVELFQRARSIYDTDEERSILGAIESAWDTVVAPYRPLAEDRVAADQLAVDSGADPSAKNALHFEIVGSEAHFQSLVDKLHEVSRTTVHDDLASASTLAWWLLAMLVLLFSASVAASIYFARKMSHLVGTKTDELRYRALHDSLTGLPNRALIMDRIEQLLVRNRRHNTSGAALFIDLDDFKNINDTLGHEAGDRLLVAVTARLTSALRDADTIGRMGGDEFVVLIDGANLEVAPELVAERLLEVMRQPFILDETTMPLTINTSIGIAVGDRSTSGDLLRDADVALYQAKAAGKNRYEAFHADMQSEILHRVELEFELRSALETHQFRLQYQPIYNLEDLTLIGVEALLRWHHPTRGVVPPDEFIPILERTGQIHDVGRWVLYQACQQMATWQAAGNTLDLSVNVSGRQLDHDTIVDDIRHALDHSGLEPSALIIEVTETALMRNTDDTARRLHAIKKLGVRIAVDDFGTGYSSLAYLQQFPVDCLKIDRMFTNAISTSPESKALIGTLVQLGKDLGLRTLAEGVETTIAMDHLRDENVNEAQGFLLSKPLDAHTFEARLLHPTRPSQPTN